MNLGGMLSGLKQEKQTSSGKKDMGQEEKDLISQDLLKKYLIYAKKYVRPKLNEIDQNKIT